MVTRRRKATLTASDAENAALDNAPAVQPDVQLLSDLRAHFFPSQRQFHSTTTELVWDFKAEEAVLGAILVNNEAYDRVLFLEPEHFADPLNRQISSVIAKLINKGQIASATTISHALSSQDASLDLKTLKQRLNNIAQKAAPLFMLRYQGLVILDQFRYRAYEERLTKPDTLDDTPLTHHTLGMLTANSPDQLREYLRSIGIYVGAIITEKTLKLASETAFKAVVAGVISNPDHFRDPITGLELPPKPRDTDFQCRGKGPSGKRMTFSEYLADTEIGWGLYTTNHLLTSSWLNELDRNLYLALMYQSNKEADESGVPNDHIKRTAAHDEFFLRHGILSPGHLENPPVGYERQAKTLTFATKLALELPKGRRPRAERE